MKNRTKRATANSAVSGLMSYAAMIAAQKWSIPLEIAASVVGFAFAGFHRLVRKFFPEEK